MGPSAMAETSVPGTDGGLSPTQNPAPPQEVAGVGKDAPKMSCLPCRKRKSKCDRNAPCSSCVLRGSEYLCYTCDELPEGAPTTGRNKGTSRPSAGQRAISNVSPAGSLVTRKNEYDSAGTGALYGGAKRKRKSSSALSPRIDAQRCHAASAEPQGRTSLPSGSPQQSEAILAGRLQAQEVLNAQLTSEVATLRQLECERRVLFEADAVSHRDIAHLLPDPLETMTVCAKVIYRHMWSIPGIHWRSFQTTLEALVLYDKPVPPLFVACLFATISMSRYLPSSQGVQADLLPRQYPQYADLAGQILDRRLGSVTTSADNLFQRLQTETILVMYHGVHSERSDIASAYFRLGNALRCASALRLFNETKWLRPVSPFKTEMYRRAAWQLFAWDRWFALRQRRPCDISAESFKVCRAEYLPDDRYDVHTGAVLPVRPLNEVSNDIANVFMHDYQVAMHGSSNVVSKILSFVHVMAELPAGERYSKAMSLDEECVKVRTELPEYFRFDNVQRGRALGDPTVLRLVTPALMMESQNQYARNVLLRPFLTDRAAPVRLRIGALDSAGAVTKMLPMMKDFSLDHHRNVPLLLHCQELYSAATTFIALLVQDDGDDPVLDSFDKSWSLEQVREILKLFEERAPHNELAAVGYKLLDALCKSKPKLRKLMNLVSSVPESSHAQARPQASRGPVDAADEDAMLAALSHGDIIPQTSTNVRPPTRHEFTPYVLPGNVDDWLWRQGPSQLDVIFSQVRGSMREGQEPWIDSFGLEECMLLPESFDSITRELDLNISSDPAFAGMDRNPITSSNDVALATQTENGRGLHSGSSATQFPLLPLPQSAPPSAVLVHPDQAALPMLQSPQHCFVPLTDNALQLSPNTQYRHPLTHDTCALPPLPHLEWRPSGDNSNTGWEQHKTPTPHAPHAPASPEQHFGP